MFTKDGLKAFHRWAHGSIELLLGHAHTMPAKLLHAPLSGFARPTIRDQILHVLSSESDWVRDLQLLPAEQWVADQYMTANSLIEARRIVETETLAYLEHLSDRELNSELQPLPEGWVGPSRSPAFILHHVLTHAFHHKGQVVAMCRILGQPAPDTDLQRDTS